MLFTQISTGITLRSLGPCGDITASSNLPLLGVGLGPRGGEGSPVSEVGRAQALPLAPWTLGPLKGRSLEGAWQRPGDHSPLPWVPVGADHDDGEDDKGQPFLGAPHQSQFLLPGQVSLE